MEVFTMAQNTAAAASNAPISSPVINPATGEVLYQLQHASVAEVNAAIEKADKAFQSWSAETPLKRTRIIMKYLELLNKNRTEIEETLTREHGKTLDDAKGEVQRGIEVVEFACGMPHMLKGDFSDNVGTGVDSYSFRQALGVVSGITPFNFPVMIPLWMFPIAVTVGNTFILKPSEVDPGVTKNPAAYFPRSRRARRRPAGCRRRQGSR
jgi:malonate-semialdehyde dehydrogenase (acetylating)/methylmalonate-semialdehyde dehydrogenase